MITTSVTDHACRVRLEGVVDLFDAGRLRRTMRQAGHASGRIVVDVDDVTFIDCSALTALDDAVFAARLDGRHVTVTSGSPAVNRVRRYVSGTEQLVA